MICLKEWCNIMQAVEQRLWPKPRNTGEAYYYNGCGLIAVNQKLNFQENSRDCKIEVGLS